MSWGIAEWYGQDIRTMTREQRAEAARIAVETNENGMANVDQPICPFLSTVRPGATCNKVGGICSIRSYEGVNPVDDDQPAATCPSRFLELADGKSIFAYMAEEFFGSADGAKVIKEIPFLYKVDADGNVNRGAKAGRIDWVLVPHAPERGNRGPIDWLAVETQAVYFSGGNMWDDIALYLDHPEQLHAPQAHRRPDFRSSGAKRLAPQLDAKAPVVRTWGRKVAVVIDEAFFAELAALPTPIDDFDNAEIVWIIMRFTEGMNLVVDRTIFGSLTESIHALQATRPLKKTEFEAGLRDELWRQGARSKVHDA